MALSSKALWDSLSGEQKKELSGIAAGWQARQASRIQAGLLASSPEGSDVDEPMDD